MPVERRAGASWTATAIAASLTLILGACEVEKRDVGPSAPLSPPTGPDDARARLYASNRYEQSEGGRLFQWVGCDRCHTEGAAGALDLTDDVWKHGGGVTDIYRTIAKGAPGMPPYESRIPSQQIWRISGYVHGLHELKPAVRRRNTNAQKGEPSGATWSGPLS